MRDQPVSDHDRRRVGCLARGRARTGESFERGAPRLGSRTAERPGQCLESVAGVVAGYGSDGDFRPRATERCQHV